MKEGGGGTVIGVSDQKKSLSTGSEGSQSTEKGGGQKVLVPEKEVKGQNTPVKERAPKTGSRL